MNLRARRRTPRRSGFTLIELTIASLVFAVLFAAMARALIGGSAAFEQGTNAADVDAQAQRLLDRIADEMRDAQLISFGVLPTPPLSTNTVSFNRVVGYAGGVVLGPKETIRVVADAGELDNGKDDNGNGLIDERRVELLPDFTKPTKIFILGHFVRRYAAGETANAKDDNGNGLVDEAGLSFTSNGSSTITIRLSVEVPDRGGRTIVRTLQTSVRIRN